MKTADSSHHTYVLLLFSRSSSMISERHRMNSEYGPWVLIQQTQSIHAKRLYSTSFSLVTTNVKGGMKDIIIQTVLDQ